MICFMFPFMFVLDESFIYPPFYTKPLCMQSVVLRYAIGMICALQLAFQTAQSYPLTMPKPDPVMVATSPVAVRKKALRGNKRAKRQLTDMQQALYEMALEHAVDPGIRASCARAWSDLQERKRVLDGKPLPGQLRPELAQLRERRASRTRKAMLSIAPSDLPASST